MKQRVLLAMLGMGLLIGAASGFAQESGLAVPEQQAMADTVQNALENNKSNQPSDWMNPDTGNSGGVTPIRTFADAQGRPCREFISTIIIGGEEQQGYGTACRQPDGSWQIVSEEPTADQEPQPQTNIYVNNPPPEYYTYPGSLYSPYHIYLSFGYLYHGGSLYRGSYFLDGRSFRHRHPIRIHQRLFITPRDRERYSRQRSWWGYRERDQNQNQDRDRRHQRYQQRRDGWDWRDRDRDNKTWREQRRRR